MAQPSEHIHWKDLMADSFRGDVSSQALFPNSRIRVLTRMDRHEGVRSQHNHDFLEIVFVVGGRARHRSLYGEKGISTGDVLVLPPRVWHGYHACRGLEIYNCCIGDEIFHEFLPFFQTDPFWSTFLSPTAVARQSQWERKFRLRGGDIARVTEEFRQLAELTQQPFDFQTNYRVLATLTRTLGELAEGLRDQARLVAAPVQLHPLVRRALELVENNISRDWRVTELCVELGGLNPAFFIRLFKQHAGVTPKAYITRRRLEKAANRLLTTEDPVTEIALDLGWEDPNLFSRNFRTFFNASPTGYRADNRARS